MVAAFLFYRIKNSTLEGNLYSVLSDMYAPSHILISSLLYISYKDRLSILKFFLCSFLKLMILSSVTQFKTLFLVKEK